MRATYENRSGVLPEHENLEFYGSVSGEVRMTIPAREAFEAVSERVDGSYLFRRPPENVVAVVAPVPGEYGYESAFRCVDEPPYPGERPCWDRWFEAALLPCPSCGAALVWYEAGYVPGYRVCAGPEHHHVMIRDDEEGA